jgi:hypothetical protein
MARYNAMRNYNKYRNGGVAHIRPSSAPMPMSRPNTLLGAAMRNQYGNNIQGYQEGTSGAYSRFKKLFKGGERRFKEETAFEKLRRQIEMQSERMAAWAGAGKWGGTLLSALIKKAFPVIGDVAGQFVLDPVLEGLGAYFGGKAGYGKDVDIDTSSKWFQPAKKEIGEYQEKITGQLGDIGLSTALTSLGTGALEMYGPKLPGAEVGVSQADLYQRAGGDAVWGNMTDWQDYITTQTSTLQT